MTPEWASVIIASVALLASGISAWYSIRISGRTLTTTTYRSATDLTLELDRVLLEYPRLRPYLYKGEPTPPPDQPDHQLVLVAAEFALDICECIWDHRAEYKREDRDAWREWIHSIFIGSPTTLSVYEENLDWYPSLRKLVTEGKCQGNHDYFLQAHRHTAENTTTSQD